MIYFPLTVLKQTNTNNQINVLISLHAVPQLLQSFIALSGKMSAVYNRPLSSYKNVLLAEALTYS